MEAKTSVLGSICPPVLNKKRQPGHLDKIYPTTQILSPLEDNFQSSYGGYPE